MVGVLTIGLSLDEAPKACAENTVLEDYIALRNTLREMGALRHNGGAFVASSKLCLVKGRLTSVEHQVPTDAFKKARDEKNAIIARLEKAGEPVADGKVDEQRMRDACEVFKVKCRLGGNVTVDARRKVYEPVAVYWSRRFMQGFRVSRKA